MAYSTKIKHASTGKTDTRYAINKEWCGYETKRYVARFCGEWLGQAEKLSGAQLHCIHHNMERTEILN